MWSLIILIPGTLIRIFTSDASLIQNTIPTLNQYFAAFIFMDLQYIGQTVFKSLNKKKQAIFFSLLRKVFIGMPKEAQDILNTYWCYLGATPDELDFLTTVQMIYKYVYFYPGQPDKKSHNLSLSLVDVIRRNGGDVWYNCEVDKILFHGDRACGVRLTNGKEYYADHIIANCSPSTVIGKMLPEGVQAPKIAGRSTQSKELTGLSIRNRRSKTD